MGRTRPTIGNKQQRAKIWAREKTQKREEKRYFSGEALRGESNAEGENEPALCASSRMDQHTLQRPTTQKYAQRSIQSLGRTRSPQQRSREMYQC